MLGCPWKEQPVQLLLRLPYISLAVLWLCGHQEPLAELDQNESFLGQANSQVGKQADHTATRLLSLAKWR